MNAVIELDGTSSPKIGKYGTNKAKPASATNNTVMNSYNEVLNSAIDI